MNTDSRPILHFHIPKTGGQSFARRVAQALPGNAAWHERGDLNNENAPAILEECLRDQIKFVSAHCAGPLFSDEHRFDYLTFIRNPLDHIISHVSHIAREPANILHTLVNNVSPIDAVKAAPEWFFDFQARYAVAAFTRRRGKDVLKRERHWLTQQLLDTCTRFKWMAPVDKMDAFCPLFFAETGLTQPDALARRNAAPDQTERWSDLRDWLQQNPHLFAVDALLYEEAIRRFEAWTKQFWARTRRASAVFSADDESARIASDTSLGRIKLGDGWSLRESSAEKGRVFQTGPKQDAYLELSDVHGTVLEFELIFTAGLSAGEIECFDARSGLALEVSVLSKYERTFARVRLPSAGNCQLLLRAPRALPLCIFSGDWSESLESVPYAAGNFTICATGEKTPAFEHQHEIVADLDV